MPALTFGVLGPVEVRSDGCPVPVPGPLRRGLLGLLVLNAGQVLPLGRITEALWGGTPPATAPAQVRAAVGVVRKALRSAGGDDVLRTSSAGYVLDAPADSCDSARFRRLVADSRAGTAAGRPDRAAELADRALRLWRGPALAGAAGAYVPAARAELAEDRIGAETQLAAAWLTLGRHVDLLPRLTGLLADHPLHQDLHAKLMLALHRAGRTGEALAAYQRLHRRLAAELGIEPGRALVELHGAILRADPALDPPAGPAEHRAVALPTAAPAQLPPAPGPFVGRRDELAGLDAAARGDGISPAVVVVTGPPGIGKSALALRWAHRERHRFPDGQLHLDLRGHDSRTALPPERALSRLLRALGVDVDRCGTDLDDLLPAYRSALADRRLLVLLDDAPASAGVLALVPGAPTCTVLVTSRARPDALALEHAVRVLDLGPLPERDGLELLGRVAGPRRRDADPRAAATLVARCGGFPLALRMVAARLATAPELTVAELVDRLGPDRPGTDRPSGDRPSGDRRGGDRQGAGRAPGGPDGPERGVYAVLAGAYAALPEPAAAVFRALATHPGESVSAPAAAVLAGVPLAEAEAGLDALVAAHLLVAGPRGRYRFLDLIRAYAAQLPGPDGAVERLVRYHVAVARAASLLFAPTRQVDEDDGWVAPAGVTLPATAAEAYGWLDAERTALEPVVRLAAERHPRLAVRLAGMLLRYHDCRGFWSDYLPIGELGLAAARRTGDAGAEAAFRGRLGIACTFTGRHAEAAEHLGAAAAAYAAADNPVRLGRTLNNLAIVERLRGRYDAALDCYRQAYALHRRCGERADMGLVLSNIGENHLAAGDVAASLPYHLAALAVRRRFGDDRDVAHALANLGDAHLRAGRVAPAVEHLRAAIELAGRAGDYAAEAQARTALGEAYAAGGDVPAGLAELDRALHRRREMGDRHGEAHVLVRIGAGHRAAGDRASARAALAAALEIRRLVPDSSEQVRISAELAAL